MLGHPWLSTLLSQYLNGLRFPWMEDNLIFIVRDPKFSNRMSSIIPIAALNRLQLVFPEKLTDCYWVKQYNLVID